MKNEILDDTALKMDGHVLITDMDSGEVLLDKHNAINFENMSKSIAYTMISNSEYAIKGIRYGINGSIHDPSGNISYKSPNVNDAEGALYEAVYTDTDLTFEILHLEDTHYSDIIITSILPYNLPEDQPEEDLGDQANSPYIFDEIGIINGVDFDPDTNQGGDYLTHIIFHPIEKSANRRLKITYTLRVKVGG